jgi:hypothetical protein
MNPLSVPEGVFVQKAFDQNAEIAAPNKPGFSIGAGRMAPLEPEIRLS